MKRLSIGPFLPLMLLLSGRVAQASPPEILTPEGAVDLALRQHPMLVAADQDVAAAEADGRLARSGYLPRLDLTEDYNRSTNPVFVFASKLGQGIFGPADFAIDSLNRPASFTNSATRLVLRQNVWDAGRTHLGSRIAGLGIEAAADTRIRTRDEVAFGALRAFWDSVLADRMLDVSNAAEEAARAHVDLARHQVESGLAVASDRMLAEVRLAEVQAMRIRAEQGTRVAKAALRQALGVPDMGEPALRPPEVEPTATAEETGILVEEALRSRPDLRALDRRIEQASLGERMARSRLLPEVGLGAQYERNDDSPFGGAGSNWSVGASIRLPIFDGLETRARLARARADRGRLEAKRRAVAEGIRLEISAAVAERLSAGERLRVAVTALDQAEEALRIVRERYGEGMAVIVELLGAEAARTAAQGNRVGAVRDLALAHAALSLATGRGLAGLAEAAGGGSEGGRRR
ncbi:MAG TPA: TolC family protein [Candidatus Polarisedimenticolia bacterium]|nr:TolC family protein [Candidatus Polarisedimenticolia bacterium]